MLYHLSYTHRNERAYLTEALPKSKDKMGGPAPSPAGGITLPRAVRGAWTRRPPLRSIDRAPHLL